MLRQETRSGVRVDSLENMLWEKFQFTPQCAHTPRHVHPRVLTQRNTRARTQRHPRTYGNEHFLSPMARVMRLISTLTE